MKMPGTGTCAIRKNNRHPRYIVVLLLLSALAVSVACAETAVTPACNILDESGTPICPDIHAAAQTAGTGQGVNGDIARFFTGMAGSAVGLKDLVPAMKKNTEELVFVAGSGITGSINQTRHMGVYATTGNGPGTVADDEPGDEIEDSGISGRLVELAKVAGSGLKNSVSQTLHSDDYPSLTDRGNDTAGDIGYPDDDEGPPPNVLRTTYAGTIRGVHQFINIVSLAVRGSLRNYSAENKSIWTNRSADDLIGSPLSGPDPDERFILKLEVPVTRVAKNASRDLSSLVAERLVPVLNVTVQPTPTPVPVPVFNLSVDSEPRGALIVINGNRTGTTPFVVTGLEQKTYTLNLTRAGYLAYGEVVTLDTDKELEIPLTPAMDAMFVTPGKSTAQNRYGGLYVTSFPDKLALTIDGVAVPSGTPYLYYGLPEGLHTVRVQRTDKPGGAVTYSRSVWVYHDALTTYNIDTEEVLLSKRVSIKAGPYSGAEFTINGRFPGGRLPATINAGCPGSFISVRKGDAYSSFLIPCTNQDTVVLSLTETTEPHPPVTVNSAPDGAEIFIDGFRTGYTTPHTFSEISGGLHRVMVSKPGLYPKDEIITVQIRDTNTTPQKVFFPLENYGEGTIVVDSLPGGASIFLNGWSPGETTPHTFDHMKIGFYEVIVQMGPRPWIEQFELTPSKVSKVVADFKI